MPNSLRICHAKPCTEHIALVCVHLSVCVYICIPECLLQYIWTIKKWMCIWAHFEMTCRIRITHTLSLSLPLSHPSLIMILNALTTEKNEGNIWFRFGVNDIIWSIWNMHASLKAHSLISTFKRTHSPEKAHWTTHWQHAKYYIRYMWRSPFKRLFPCVLVCFILYVYIFLYALKVPVLTSFSSSSSSFSFSSSSLPSSSKSSSSTCVRVCDMFYVLIRK